MINKLASDLYWETWASFWTT